MAIFPIVPASCASVSVARRVASSFRSLLSSTSIRTLISSCDSSDLRVSATTESVIAETRKSLDSHELIKVRIDVDESRERRSLAERLAAETDAQIAGTIGKIAILYRERDEEPEIRLPR